MSCVQGSYYMIFSEGDVRLFSFVVFPKSDGAITLVPWAAMHGSAFCTKFNPCTWASRPSSAMAAVSTAFIHPPVPACSQPGTPTTLTHLPSIYPIHPVLSFLPLPVCLFFLSFSLFLPSIMELNCVRELLCRLFSHSVTATVIVCVLRPGVVFARVCFFASEASDLALCAICCRHAHSPMIGSFCA